MRDWKEKTLEYWPTINRMAARRFGEGVLAEEAALAVVEGLKAGNWQRLREYKEQSTLKTFVRTLTVRLLEDFARKRFGRIRPPLWVKTFGGIWEKLFTALCFERLPVAEAVEIVLQRQTAAGKEEIESAAYSLLARIPDCGAHQGLEVAYGEENSSDGDHGVAVPDRALEKQQKKEVLEAIFQLVLGETEFAASGAFLRRVSQLQLCLTPEEKLLLKLCYQDDLGVTKAGKMLGMTRFQVHGKKRRLMVRLKGEFERTGLAKDLRLLLDDL